MNRKNWCEYCEEGKEARHMVSTADYAMGHKSACDECSDKFADEGDGLVWTGYEWVDPLA